MNPKGLEPNYFMGRYCSFKARHLRFFFFPSNRLVLVLCSLQGKNLEQKSTCNESLCQWSSRLCKEHRRGRSLALLIASPENFRERRVFSVRNLALITGFHYICFLQIVLLYTWESGGWGHGDLESGGERESTLGFLTLPLPCFLSKAGLPAPAGLSFP